MSDRPPLGFTGPTDSRRGPAMTALALGAIGVLVLLLVGIAWALGLGPFAPAGTLVSPSNLPASAPGSTAHATSTPVSSGPPSVVPESPTVTLPPATASTATDQLLSHVPEVLHASCAPDRFIEPALALVSCTADDGTISVSYTLYAEQASMQADYDKTVIVVGIESNSGRCYNTKDDGTLAATKSRWPSENGYTVDNVPAGRYLCYDAAVPTIAWTDDRLYILGVATASSGDSDRLVSFWATEAGPVP